jgi:single-stranded-DNA-specific exonuclease
VKRGNYDALYSALNRMANSLPELPTLKVRPDFRLHGSEISLSTAREIRRLEPFGSGNPTPLFYIPAAQIIAASPVGEGHTGMILRCEGFEVRAVMFGTAKNGFDFKPPDIVDLAASLDVNIYKNNETLSVIVRNIRKSACYGYYGGLFKTFLSGGQIGPDALRLRLRPTRGEFADVYRLLVSGGGTASLEAVCNAVCRRDMHFNYFKLLLIINVFTGSGLITLTSPPDSDSVTYRINRDKKIDLTASALLGRLG